MRAIGRFFLAAVAGAAPGPAGLGASPGGFPRPAHLEHARQERHQLAARQATARCGLSDGSCPEGIGLWTMLEPKGPPSMCTSFLVAPDLALTNHHCIPLASRAAGADCRNLAWLHFPRTRGARADSVSCREVVAISATSEKIDQPDWALVRLARPVEREIAPLAIDGVRDMDTLIGWAFHPDWSLLTLRERLAADLRPIDCRASRRTKAFRDPGSRSEYSDSLSRRIPLCSCPAQKGNSGTPLFRRDADGTWRIHALLDRSAPVNGVRDWVRSQGLSLLDSEIGEFAYATNLSCIPFPGRPVVPGICQRDSNPATIQADNASWKREVERAISEQVAQIPSPVPLVGTVLQKGLWSGYARGAILGPSNTEGFVVPLPACSTPGTSDTLYQFPTWGVRFGFDRDLRWAFRMETERPRLGILKRCRPHPSVAGLDICSFDGRFPGIGAIPLRTDTLARCLSVRGPEGGFARPVF